MAFSIGLGLHILFAMYKQRSYSVLLVVLSSILLLQACSPFRSDLGTEAEDTQSSQSTDPPRLSFTRIPNVEITLDKTIGQKYLSRPRLSGSPISITTKHFRIHFTTTGEDAVSGADWNFNGIPDFVEEVAKTMEYVRDVQVNYFGWPAPPVDTSKDGQGHYDVYLEHYSNRDTLGYAEATNIQYIKEGDSIIRTGSAASYISMENDFYDPDDSTDVLDLMRVTAAHEFFHAIQLSLDNEEPMTWFWEATATWMEDEVFDGINRDDHWLDLVFESPDTCIAAKGELDEDRRYGMWIFPRYLSENYGHSIVQDIWYSTVEFDGYDAIKNTLEVRSLDPQDVFENYLIALLTRDFEEGRRYPTVILEEVIVPDDTFITWSGVGSLGADFIEISGSGELTITLKADELDGIIVGIDRKQSAIFPMIDGTVSVDADDYDHLYLIVVNHNEANIEDECQRLGYEVEVISGGQVLQTPLLRPAPNFRRP